jgi:hypothetical protein
MPAASIFENKYDSAAFSRLIVTPKRLKSRAKNSGPTPENQDF